MFKTSLVLFVSNIYVKRRYVHRKIFTHRVLNKQNLIFIFHIPSIELPENESGNKFSKTNIIIWLQVMLPRFRKK